MKVPVRLKYTIATALLGITTLCLDPTPSFAATATAPIAVSATVVATCVVSATALGFGSYTGVVNNASSTVTVQ
jgi:spore coat protein U-like protein